MDLMRVFGLRPGKGIERSVPSFRGRIAKIWEKLREPEGAAQSVGGWPGTPRRAVTGRRSPTDIALHRTLSNQERKEIAAGVILQVMSVQTRQASRKGADVRMPEDRVTD